MDIKKKMNPNFRDLQGGLFLKVAKADVGDRESAADVALGGGKAEVKSAETGAFGLEAGAGLTIPLGDEGSSIFMDASVELRADYTNVNGTVGYRINF